MLESLNQIVRGTEQFRSAEAARRLIEIPTGDGMALVFYNSPETPVILSSCSRPIDLAAIGIATPLADPRIPGFSLPNDLDSIILVILPTSNYAAIVSGKNDGTGISLLEVYRLP